MKRRHWWARIKWPRLTRDGLAVAVGLVVAYHETFQTKQDRVSAWGAVVTLIGGPIYWRILDKKRDEEGDRKKSGGGA